MEALPTRQVSRMCGRPRPANQPGLKDVRSHMGSIGGAQKEGLPCRSPNARALSFAAGRSGCSSAGVILVMVLVEARPDHPGDGRCAGLWNAPANHPNRSVVRGRSFPLATVRGVPPNKAGQPGCSVLLREREDGPWLWFGAVVTETSVVWDGGVSGVRYGTDSPTGDVDDTPNAMLQPDGSLVLR
jgi:hypothetical protein